MEFNNSLAAVHGYLCSDGYVIKNPETQKHKYYHIGFRNMCPELLKDFQSHFIKSFNMAPYICEDGRCRIQNKAIYQKLTEKYSYYSREWHMPSLTKEQLSYWLRAYFDSESWVRVNARKTRLIGLDSVNREGIFQIQEGLKKLHVESIVKYRKERNIYRLLIYGKENLEKYQNQINFLHPKKKHNLAKAILSYVNYEWDVNDNFYHNKIKTFLHPKRIRISSIKVKNLEDLKKYLMNTYGIRSKIYNCKRYHELCIQHKEDIEKCYEITNQQQLGS